MLKNDISKLHYIIKWCVFVEITKGRQTSWFVCWASTCFQYLKIQDVVCVQVASWVIIVVIFWTGTSQSTLYTSHHFIEPVHLLIPDGHMQRGTCSSCCQQCSFSFVCDSGKLHLWGFFFFFFFMPPTWWKFKTNIMAFWKRIMMLDLASQASHALHK